jgi:hypothetical protein
MGAIAWASTQCPDGASPEPMPHGSPAFLAFCGVKESNRLADAPRGFSAYSRLEIYQPGSKDPVFRSEKESWLRVVKRSLEIQEIWWLGEKKGAVTSTRLSCGAKSCRLEAPRCALAAVKKQFPRALQELKAALAKGPSPRPMDRLVAEVLVQAIAGDAEAKGFLLGATPETLPESLKPQWLEATKDLERLEKMGCLRNRQSSKPKR